MNWRNTLRTKTRQPAFLWRMVIGMIAAGVVLGALAQFFFFSVNNRGDKDPPGSHQGWQELEQLAETGQWWEVWWRVPRQIYSGYQNWGPPVLAAIAGICWLAFLLQSLRIASFRDGRLWCALIGVALGMLSIWPTGFFILWQEVGWGLEKRQELAPGLRYYVLGVGLREEFAKFCCVLPLMPILLRWRNELSALLISSCVGLGFAVEENVSYFFSDQTATMGRFLTANPFHVVMTGLIGLSAYRAFRDPRNWGPHAPAMFGLMVFAHGLYDAAIDVPAIAEYGLVGTIVFALVVYQFFRELRDLRPAGGDVISLSATFLFGVSLLTSATFIYLSATEGLSVACDTLAQGVVGLAIMVYLFLREMPESMVRV
ncbi:MAG: PrsW family intramembrane metalloprotease [Pirellulales bacterium]|nr:PrsW family intramembrane metalloprotease [Pirellulales bacterium]